MGGDPRRLDHAHVPPVEAAAGGRGAALSHAGRHHRGRDGRHCLGIAHPGRGRGPGRCAYVRCYDWRDCKGATTSPCTGSRSISWTSPINVPWSWRTPPGSTPADLAAIHRRLERLDRASGSGPWTATVLALIGRYPERRAPTWPRCSVARPHLFKLDVRKLKIARAMSTSPMARTSDPAVRTGGRTPSSSGSPVRCGSPSHPVARRARASRGRRQIWGDVHTWCRSPAGRGSLRPSCRRAP